MLTFEEWRKIVDDTPDDDVVDFVRENLRDKSMLHIFGRFFFPHIIKGDYETPEAHLDLIAEISKPTDSGIIFPRGFAKSTWEKIDLIHDIVYQLEPVIVYISATIKDASFHFTSIKAELENNELLRDFYGNLVPSERIVGRKWTNLHFETTNGINVVARGRIKGRGVNINNQRPTKIVIDDVEDDEQVNSLEQREKLANWLYGVIFPSKDPHRGKIKMIGTVLHTASEVLKFYNEHGGIFRQAIEHEQSIWPEQYTMADLEKIRDGYVNEQGRKISGIGTRRFAQEYLNNPTDESVAHVKPQWIDGAMYVSLPRHPLPMLKVITIDPQAGEKAQADEYAITCVGYFERDPHRYVLEQKCGRASQLVQAVELVKMWLRHKSARVVGVEKVLNQTAVYQIMNSWRNKAIDFQGVDQTDRNIPIAAIDPKGKDKLARLEKHEPAFERGEIHLRPEMRDLREQIMYLGTKILAHDDRCDSLVMALDLCQRNTLVANSNSGYTKKEQTISGDLYKQQF